MERLIRVLLGLWNDFDDWDDQELVVARTAASIPHIESVYREIQRETRLFQLRVFEDLELPAVTLTAPIEMYPRARVDLLDVYQRPARDYSEAVAGGSPPEEAFTQFTKRLTGIVEYDAVAVERDEVDRINQQLEREGLLEEPDEPLFDDNNPDDVSVEDLEQMVSEMERQIAEAEAEDELGSARPKSNADDEGGPNKIIGYRRILRPELSMSGSCGLCVVAATRWYTRKNLKAIHGLCKCKTVPITKANDPGLKMNAEDLRGELDRMYAAAGGNTRKALKLIRVAVREHGELGPTLVYSPKRGWEPTGDPIPYQAPTVEDQLEKYRRRRDALEATRSNLQISLRTGDRDRTSTTRAIGEITQQLREIEARLAA
ncbi:hypothetical protein ACSHWG_00860 [Leucobacter sp. Z1108]|uniref:hypothetical protein n=1 Tax=Leucobacter sp. Z1108 TaxID=3439066 RepID=UPI003F3F554D